MYDCDLPFVHSITGAQHDVARALAQQVGASTRLGWSLLVASRGLQTRHRTLECDRRNRSCCRSGHDWPSGYGLDGRQVRAHCAQALSDGRLPARAGVSLCCIVLWYNVLCSNCVQRRLCLCAAEGIDAGADTTGLQDTAWTVVKFAHIARKHGLTDVCLHALG